LTGQDLIQYTIKDSRNGYGLGKILLGVASSNTVTGTLTGIGPSGNGMGLTFAGVPWCAYGLERSSNVTGAWEWLGTLFPAEDGQGAFTDTNAPLERGFYRLR
jgi:hypothetical protein